MRARQIDEFDRRALSLESSDMPLDGHARVIADALLEPGQAIEQCTFARIRIANNRDARVGALRYGYFIDGNAGFGGLSHQPLQVQSESIELAPGAAKYRNRRDGIPSGRHQ